MHKKGAWVCGGEEKKTGKGTMESHKQRIELLALSTKTERRVLLLILPPFDLSHEYVRFISNNISSRTEELAWNFERFEHISQFIFIYHMQTFKFCFIQTLQASIKWKNTMENTVSGAFTTSVYHITPPCESFELSVFFASLRDRVQTNVIFHETCAHEICMEEIRIRALQHLFFLLIFHFEMRLLSVWQKLTNRREKKRLPTNRMGTRWTVKKPLHQNYVCVMGSTLAWRWTAMDQKRKEQHEMCVKQWWQDGAISIASWSTSICVSSSVFQTQFI